MQVQKLYSFSGHRDGIYALAQGGKPGVFYSAGSDGMVVQWDLARPDEGKLLATTANPIYSLCFSGNENALLVGQNFDGITLLDLEGGKEARSLHITSETQIFAIQKYKNTVWVGLGNGELAVVDFESFSTLQRSKLADKSIRCIAVHPSKPEIAIGLSDNSIRIFQSDTYQPLYRIDSHTLSVFSLTYSPDGRFLLSGSRDAHLKIWDASQGYILHEDIVAHMHTINNIAYSPDGQYLATCSKDKSVKIWTTNPFTLRKVLDQVRYAGHGTSVNALLWLSNDTLASASDDRMVSIWKVDR